MSVELIPRMPRLLRLICLTLAACAAFAQPVRGAGAGAAVPMPTMQDLSAMYDAGQYRTCAQQVARALNLKTAAAQDYDRGRLLALRGDCLINLGDRAGAIKAYTDAQKSGDPDVWCHARAMELLVRGGKYRPKPASRPTTAAADVDPAAGATDSAAMQQALSDLLDVQRKRAEPQVRAAERATNLAPIIEALPEMMDLYALERTATGNTDDIAPRIRAIGGVARTLIARELAQLDVRVHLLEGLANSSADSGGGVATGGGRGGGGGGARGGGGGGQWWSGDGVTRRGLFSTERDDLRELTGYVAKIQATGERAHRLARDFNGMPEAWDPLITQCATIQALAEGLLDSN